MSHSDQSNGKGKPGLAPLPFGFLPPPPGMDTFDPLALPNTPVQSDQLTLIPDEADIDWVEQLEHDPKELARRLAAQAKLKVKRAASPAPEAPEAPEAPVAAAPAPAPKPQPTPKPQPAPEPVAAKKSGGRLANMAPPAGQASAPGRLVAVASAPGAEQAAAPRVAKKKATKKAAPAAQKKAAPAAKKKAAPAAKRVAKKKTAKKKPVTSAKGGLAARARPVRAMSASEALAASRAADAERKPAPKAKAKAKAKAPAPRVATPKQTATEVAEPASSRSPAELVTEVLPGAEVTEIRAVGDAKVFRALWLAHRARALAAGDAALGLVAARLLEAAGSAATITALRVTIASQEWVVFTGDGALLGALQPAEVYLAGL